MNPTQSRVRELFDYNQDTGELVWRVKKKGGNPGQLAGCIHYSRSNRKYRLAVVIDGKYFCAPRIIYLWMTGRLPEQIDHIDGNPMNNKWSNIRPATHGQNQQNKGVFINNKLGIKGVKQTKWGYVANIRVNGKLINLGTHKTPELAHSAYCEAATKHFGEFARHA